MWEYKLFGNRWRYTYIQQRFHTNRINHEPGWERKKKYCNADEMSAAAVYIILIYVLRHAPI